jgi:hypothetical protein
VLIIVEETSMLKFFKLVVDWEERRETIEDACETFRGGGAMGFTIMRIYQTLTVEVQTARANQVYFTKTRNFAVNARPCHPRDLRSLVAHSSDDK